MLSGSYIIVKFITLLSSVMGLYCVFVIVFFHPLPYREVQVNPQKRRLLVMVSYCLLHTVVTNFIRSYSEVGFLNSIVYTSQCIIRRLISYKMNKCVVL